MKHCLRIVLATMLLVQMLGGCTSWQAIDMPTQDGTHQQSRDLMLETGDMLVIRTGDGRIRELTFLRADENQVYCLEGAIEIGQITEIKKRKFSVAKTVLMVGGSALLGAALISGLESAGAGFILNAATP